MTMIYMDQDQTIAEPRNSYQRADRTKWLADFPIGSIPASELNPVLFSY